ncbi:MAG TPA: hypothetical protein VK539_06660 [Myxococcaceae bacterium]|nr:hypothetical protein [Myxococcaceae bacterium]
MRWPVFIMQLCAVMLASPAEAHPDSLRLKLLAALARGDTAGAIALWQAESGAQTVPKSLQSFQAAFNTVNRVAGPCVRVAKDIYEGFSFLGGQSQYVRISSTGGNYLSWQSRILMSDNNSHTAVRHGAKIYDAFTGPAGMSEAEYVKQLHYAGALVLKTVTMP